MLYEDVHSVVTILSSVIIILSIALKSYVKFFLDLTIENSLKTCEEVWLGKVFEVQPHTRGLSRAQSAELEAGSELTGSEMMPHAVLQPFEGSRFVLDILVLSMIINLFYELCLLVK